MNEYLLIKFLHLIGFAYWLGGDLGVFHSSYWVANPRHSPEVRVAAAKILFWLDQIPRICMTLMLPLGLQLAYMSNLLAVSPLAMTLIWLGCFAWLGMVLYLHAAAASPFKSLLTNFDFWFRLALSLALLGTGAAALFADTFAWPYWIALKLMIYGGLVGLGLLVRIKLKPFGPAFARIAQGQGKDADDAAIRASLGGTRPLVVAIWLGLFASAALGTHLI
ncbi:MAG: hypothetical protein AAGE85_02460 [Pseudomonadota bacterium]